MAGWWASPSWPAWWTPSPAARRSRSAFTSQIADLLNRSLQAKGVAVVMEAKHACMTCRGVKKPNSVMITSVLRGICRSDARTRAEVMALLHNQNH